MTRSSMITLLTGWADDLAYHATNLAQGIMDIAVLTAVGLVLYASGLDAPQAGPVQTATVQPQPATTCSTLVQVSCITEQVLQAQDS